VVGSRTNVAEPQEYLVHHIQDALAADPRARELGVDVQVAGDRVVLTGTAATPAQRASIALVVGEVADGYEVVNEMTVVSADEDGPAEELNILPAHGLRPGRSGSDALPSRSHGRSGRARSDALRDARS
jgi:BON domain